MTLKLLTAQVRAQTRMTLLTRYCSKLLTPLAIRAKSFIVCHMKFSHIAAAKADLLRNRRLSVPSGVDLLEQLPTCRLAAPRPSSKCRL